MSETEVPVCQEAVPVQKRPKFKRDIVHFAGEKPTAINLDHVAGMRLDGKTIFFDCYTKTQPVDLDDEVAAKSVFQSLLNVWSGDVVE